MNIDQVVLVLLFTAMFVIVWRCARIVNSEPDKLPAAPAHMTATTEANSFVETCGRTCRDKVIKRSQDRKPGLRRWTMTQQTSDQQLGCWLNRSRYHKTCPTISMLMMTWRTTTLNCTTTMTMNGRPNMTMTREKKSRGSSQRIRSATVTSLLSRDMTYARYLVKHREPYSFTADNVIRAARHLGAREAGRRARRPGALPASPADVGGAVHRCPPQRAEGAPAPGRWMGGEAQTAVRSAATCVCKPPNGGDGRRPAEPEGPTRSTTCVEEPAKAGSRAARGGPPKGRRSRPAGGAANEPRREGNWRRSRRASSPPGKGIAAFSGDGEAALSVDRRKAQRPPSGRVVCPRLTLPSSRTALLVEKQEDQQYVYRND